MLQENDGKIISRIPLTAESWCSVETDDDTLEQRATTAGYCITVCSRKSSLLKQRRASIH